MEDHWYRHCLWFYSELQVASVVGVAGDLSVVVNLQSFMTIPTRFAIGTFWFWLPLHHWTLESPHRFEITPSVASTAILTCVGVVHVKCISEVCLYQTFITDVAFCCGFELGPILFCHYNRLWAKLRPHNFFASLQPGQKHQNCIFSSVHEWAVRFSITSHYDVRKPTCFVNLCFDRCLIFLA